MSRFGTCRYAHQIQEVWLIPVHHQPHEPAETHIAMPEGEYTCQWLDTAGDLPPPVRRIHGGLGIRPTDCDECPAFDAAADLSILTR